VFVTCVSVARTTATSAAFETLCAAQTGPGQEAPTGGVVAPEGGYASSAGKCHVEDEPKLEAAAGSEGGRRGGSAGGPEPLAPACMVPRGVGDSVGSGGTSFGED